MQRLAAAAAAALAAARFLFVFMPKNAFGAKFP
jgi:hypothetical protein